MNMSLRRQLTVSFIGLITALFLANYLVNTFFLEDYYYMRKKEVLVNAYDILNRDTQNPAEDMEELTGICLANGVSLVVIDSDNYVRLRTIWTGEDQIRLMRARLNGYQMGFDIDDVKELVQTDEYTIQRRYDEEAGQEFLEMWGILSTGYSFLMRFSVEGVAEDVGVSNEFVKYICLTGVVLAAVIVWLISKRVTQPLHELTELSKRMSELDFDVKYTSGGSNEIGQLGAHFNRMSENLEKAYSDLLTANNELQKDIERKEQIDDMRKEFLSNVSHELKTPIALIQGYAEGLAECINDDAESREFYCEVIMDEAGKMNGMVQKLLTLNQLEFGNDKVVMERFDLAVLLRNKIQSISILAQQKEAVISYHGADVAAVWGDEFKVEEVITNYLSNALNHVSGRRQIDVTVQELGDVVRVSVLNTGEQIPEQDIGQIWDKFYKVDKARTREYGGSGVGLSIVKAIMEALHQEYGVRNCEEGVEFWFTLKNGNNVCGDGESVGWTVMDNRQLQAEVGRTVMDSGQLPAGAGRTMVNDRQLSPEGSGGSLDHGQSSVGNEKMDDRQSSVGCTEMVHSQSSAGCLKTDNGNAGRNDRQLEDEIREDAVWRRLE